VWSSNILIIFIINSKIAFVFEIELRMKNHCGESVGFSFRAALWFRQGFCLCQVSETNVPGEGGAGTWVNVCWVSAAGLLEPLPQYSLFFGQYYRPHLSHFWTNI